MTKEINEAKAVLERVEKAYTQRLKVELAKHGLYAFESSEFKTAKRIINKIDEKINDAENALDAMQYWVNETAIYPFLVPQTETPAENAESPVESITDAEGSSAVISRAGTVSGSFATASLDKAKIDDLTVLDGATEFTPAGRITVGTRVNSDAMIAAQVKIFEAQEKAKKAEKDELEARLANIEDNMGALSNALVEEALIRSASIVHIEQSLPRKIRDFNSNPREQ